MHIEYPAPQPHGRIRQLLPDFFVVRGTARIAPGVVVNRNMGIVRSGEDLLLVNPVRLCPAGEERLCDLGRVRQAVRLGYYHGCDDLYYRDRFNVFFWRQEHSNHYPVPPADQFLVDGGTCPVSGGRVFEFSNSRVPEAALLVPQAGGLLLTCDALQYWRDWTGCSWAGKWLLRFGGVHRGMQVVQSWRSRATPGDENSQRWLAADFQRLLNLPFFHLLAAHGDFCADNAHELTERAVSGSFLLPAPRP
ncbi:hypothetical protein PVT68_10945 [Microbulbifer bruguierae]|uniref:Uncharacterized protein n=1 Tax=Microbulbifer bruguierae TaxID=3029061 RepID=A0ABY8N8Q3_9GAMM|nr:hypothetical protein [Microbulbifer bruguierae]WGL15286.1 hypothetical protein PVT68_10945 [Microbulbifer bruguierae]